MTEQVEVPAQLLPVRAGSLVDLLRSMLSSVHDENALAVPVKDLVEVLDQSCSRDALGCRGDGRYAAPGRGHESWCTHPRPLGSDVYGAELSTEEQAALALCRLGYALTEAEKRELIHLLGYPDVLPRSDLARLDMAWRRVLERVAAENTELRVENWRLHAELRLARLGLHPVNDWDPEFGTAEVPTDKEEGTP